MREATIERHLRRRVKETGGLCWKWVSPGRTGVPDRILIYPSGVIAFVETKVPGEKERPIQVLVQSMLVKMGCLVFSSVDSREKVDQVIAEMLRRIPEAKS